MGTISSGFHNFNENSFVTGTVPSDFHNLNENSHSQNFSNFSPEFSTPNHIRPRSNSAPRASIPNSTSFSTISNTAVIRQSQQRRNEKICFCGLEPVLREVKINTPNKGRFFWSCRKFGGPNHSEKCNFFKWETQTTQNTDVAGESSSLVQNTYDTPDNNDDDDDVKDVNIVNVGDEVNTSPLDDNDMVTRIIANPRRSHSRTSLSNASIRTTTNRTTNPVPDSNETHTAISLTGDIYTRKPAIFGNWESVPKYSTPQLLDIMQNHLVQQDKNYQRWHTETQLSKKDLEDAKKEVEKLMRELEIINRENVLYKRENELLKGEKRLLEHENNELKEENRELKRRY
ncbi:hypothetical protein RclHR1_01070021 [Rhizophagus clarus]|uniref:GRF-type domain-containing protein n=1 Tax=Rhizophagus clarus TaxID=94130 RepID=A0A2Z6QGY9_9GLOM|nr:hypothetical protein RclHR1_01070021 [Rhizophagus clarus]GET04835.1 hypothetical protein GLOIN_2v1884800 [Rhizophagus clarus]